MKRYQQINKINNKINNSNNNSNNINDDSINIDNIITIDNVINNNSNDGLLIKRAQSYIMFTFYLMRHFVMNTKYVYRLKYDKSI